MRVALLIVLSLLWALPTQAGDARVTIHSARPFGYFVGDLIRARIEITTSADATLAAASLPRPGPLSVSLDLKAVEIHATTIGAEKRWDLDLVYQNFYVALDARNIEIPGFELHFGDETVLIPAWSVGVAPLREIAPAKQERPEDYLRPDSPTFFANETQPERLAITFGALSILVFGAVARDRAWPPFQRRRERIFNALARELAAKAHAGHDALPGAIQRMHRTIDGANGGTLLGEDVSTFLARRPEFASLQSSFDRFFAASRGEFFSEGKADTYGFAELLDFARALARQERAQ
ncbi:nonribosomal peptide synthetase MxaA [Methylocystis sp. WRRC1]|uniref:nonribosomal peptide synthetase MxaA n=1 Tax=Methylocystis sp. WRRC1 TaxID=1732014 RepID=UPI001D1458A3|nr:nonribosomal peptide synthetase MxaA [Methylocystis sp. WRRC1]MCC3246790.1 nonribosomal peptide synthetase MxaA [Methylocystis sp. WRRC1]